MILVALVTMGSGTVEPLDSTRVPDLLVETLSVAQEENEQYNVSSYYEFALATGAVLSDKLVLYRNGIVWHYGFPTWGPEFGWAPSVADYYWAIAGMARIYDITGNETLSIMITRAAESMINGFADPHHPGFYVNLYHPDNLLAQSKRAGVQAYAYEALSIAESVNDTLDFTEMKQKAMTCLTDVLYDSANGGLRFMTYPNCTLDDEGDAYEVYPNDGKRLDHLALGAIALYDEGIRTSNSTLIAMADSSLSFMIEYMPVYNDTVHQGFRLATNSTGGVPIVPSTERPARIVITDLNAMAIRALLKGYNVTGNSTYLDWAEDTHKALLFNNWDTQYGGWYVEVLDGVPYAPLGFEDTERYKYSEIQFQMVRAQELLYVATGNTFYIQLVIDTLDIVLAKLWDQAGGGFFTNGDEASDVWTDDWRNHYTGVQALGVLALEKVWGFGLPIVSYVRVSPTNPRPNDKITLMATALDEDGIDRVMVNYTLSGADPENSSQVELEPNAEFGGVFNTTIDELPDGTGVNFVVIANDTLGKSFVAGNYYFEVREDIWAPVVLLRAVYPTDAVREGDDVVIEFGTYEFPTHSHLEYFKMYWKVNNGDYTPSNMSAVDVDEQYLVWQIYLGQFAAGDVISYYCLAEDESGNQAESAFYRLTILGAPIFTNPLLTWQTLAAIGLVAAPGLGYGIARIRRQNAMSTQRELKKEARKRSTKKRPRRKRSTRSG